MSFIILNCIRSPVFSLCIFYIVLIYYYIKAKNLNKKNFASWTINVTYIIKKIYSEAYIIHTWYKFQNIKNKILKTWWWCLKTDKFQSNCDHHQGHTSARNKYIHIFYITNIFLRIFFFLLLSMTLKYDYRVIETCRFLDFYNFIYNVLNFFTFCV